VFPLTKQTSTAKGFLLRKETLFKKLSQEKGFFTRCQSLLASCYQKSEARNKDSEVKKQITIIPIKAFLFNMLLNILASCFFGK